VKKCSRRISSCDMVLAAMQPDGKLHVANLGDCGVKVRDTVYLVGYESSSIPSRKASRDAPSRGASCMWQTWATAVSR
jgi:hypothetical protein